MPLIAWSLPIESVPVFQDSSTDPSTQLSQQRIHEHSATSSPATGRQEIDEEEDEQNPGNDQCPPPLRLLENMSRLLIHVEAVLPDIDEDASCDHLVKNPGAAHPQFGKSDRPVRAGRSALRKAANEMSAAARDDGTGTHSASPLLEHPDSRRLTGTTVGAFQQATPSRILSDGTHPAPFGSRCSSIGI